jgi:rhodanese-related sulfurtransferase
MKKNALITLVLIMILVLAACGASAPSNSSSDSSSPEPLPAASPDPESQFGVDLNINISTIDNYLGRSDVAYRDARMLYDPADFGAIGGNADLSSTITGFRIVPYPYLGTLTELPCGGAYSGETLYDLTWAADGSIASAEPNYKESLTILEDLFPKDKSIFLMCGGGGYAASTKALLVHLGWDAEKIYNIGGNWEYKGSNSLELIEYAKDEGGEDLFATWRADYALIDFSLLHKI